MIFITGGAFQCKTDTACQLFGVNRSDIISGYDCGFEDVFTAVCINSYHRLVARLMEADIDPVEFTERLCSENKGCIIIMDEIGCGIVPMEKKERIYRENVGRCGCIIAAESEKAFRVVCGIPQYLKGGAK
ncbi:bifunctional adenosylcobinamide kinase/adenosylcobinamide-phosphate guanylyltransferase [Ruminococcus flavefaciens]|uniref:bifunctional adenosylcobinamide kinase/adenosylcobinamide-phosphate guanylyltransferase n=1 Tax=Ruminococcus flavefaciens TaxID=1265 RepID=UPI0026EDD588|nr:bifunctional adenosylcobinamide kinase/adenosylcobinamide-phosphate guanylyltransferase [Ruminococcus flavefaciens]MDD7515687.1 bifunctional adenosylcobinamide kinase/adenosylcobinamide-phosphate guanylyltransferase [Ruminococcus flavefaciens]MDY5690307.1 bifunctional adenosylcobinamide kinase/adenosylcobinamide-phosphate guanylyltransferase [Ruminococcus flavefaciens]